MSPETVEGRLIAQRMLLTRLAAIVLGGDDADRQWLSELLADSSPSDQQEDPGAVPDPAFAIEGAVADELRLIGRQVREILEASR